MTRDKKLGLGRYYASLVQTAGKLDGIVVYSGPIKGVVKAELKLSNQEASDLFDFLLEHMTRLVQAQKGD